MSRISYSVKVAVCIAVFMQTVAMSGDAQPAEDCYSSVVEMNSQKISARAVHALIIVYDDYFVKYNDGISDSKGDKTAREKLNPLDYNYTIFETKNVFIINVFPNDFKVLMAEKYWINARDMKIIKRETQH